MGKPGPEDVIEETQEENKSESENSKEILLEGAENKIKDEIVKPEDILISGMHESNENKDNGIKVEETNEKGDLKVLLTEENLLIANLNIEDKV